MSDEEPTSAHFVVCGPLEFAAAAMGDGPLQQDRLWGPKLYYSRILSNKKWGRVGGNKIKTTVVDIC